MLNINQEDITHFSQGKRQVSFEIQTSGISTMGDFSASNKLTAHSFSYY